MHVRLLWIEPAVGDAYQIGVQVNEAVHQVCITIQTDLLPGTSAPLLTATGDDVFYQVLGGDYPDYPEILKQVTRYHLGEVVRLPLDLQATVSV